MVSLPEGCCLHLGGPAGRGPAGDGRGVAVGIGQAHQLAALRGGQAAAEVLEDERLARRIDHREQAGRGIVAELVLLVVARFITGAQVVEVVGVRTVGDGDDGVVALGLDQVRLLACP